MRTFLWISLGLASVLGASLLLSFVPASPVPEPLPVVESAPAANFGFEAGGRSELQPGTTISRSAVLRFRLQADPEFAAALPDDARYIISEVSLYLKQGLSEPKLLRKVRVESDRGQLALASLLEDARPGTQLICLVGNCYRINYKGQRIREPLTERVRSILLTLGA